MQLLRDNLVSQTAADNIEVALLTFSRPSGRPLRLSHQASPAPPHLRLASLRTPPMCRLVRRPSLRSKRITFP